MSRYRRIYGKTHDTVHIRDDETNRKIYDEVNELNELNEIIESMHYFLKEKGYDLIRIDDDIDVRWMVTTPEDVIGYKGEADIKTYEEYIESIRK